MTTPRVLIGKSGSSEILAVSKPTIDVTTATDPTDFLFNSVNGIALFGQPYMSGVITGLNALYCTGGLSPKGGAWNPVSPIITHGLGFIPHIYLFPSTKPITFSGGAWNFWPEITTTQLLIYVPADGFASTFLPFDGGNTISYVIMNLPAF